jgi:hypothetical protein
MTREPQPNLERILLGPEGRPVKVSVSPPVKLDTPDDHWRCSYTIEGIGDGKRREAFGVDGIQALLLALTQVSTTLYTSPEYMSGHLVWKNGKGSDLGLPIAIAVREYLNDNNIVLE